MFQSLDWVDVDFDVTVIAIIGTHGSFNPSTGLMLISTWVDVDFDRRSVMAHCSLRQQFQSLDWVDVDFDPPSPGTPSTYWRFQSLDWVDVDFDQEEEDKPKDLYEFQSLDWVDVDFDSGSRTYLLLDSLVSIPRLG